MYVAKDIWIFQKISKKKFYYSVSSCKTISTRSNYSMIKLFYVMFRQNLVTVRKTL